MWVFAWRSPSGLIHGGWILDMHTACGIRVPTVKSEQGRRWKLLARRSATCRRCQRSLGT